MFVVVTILEQVMLIIAAPMVTKRKRLKSVTTKERFAITIPAFLKYPQRGHLKINTLLVLNVIIRPRMCRHWGHHHLLPVLLLMLMANVLLLSLLLATSLPILASSSLVSLVSFLLLRA